MTSEILCDEIKRKIDGALAQQTRPVKSITRAGDAEWIEVDVRMVPPGTASATVVHHIGGREFAHPEIAVDVMDKPFGPAEAERLASEVARAVMKATKT